MCGISGIISRTKRVSVEQIEQISSLLTHRGPDASGVWVSENGRMALGHQRLSIIDITDQSNQPYVSSSGKTVMVYNGELYNYKELTSKYNLKPKTKGDVEVVIELLEQEGANVLPEFNGMFAIAWIDIESGELSIVRDHLGIKPVYYSQAENGDLVFGSELRTILHSSDTHTIDRDALAQFLELGFFAGEKTILKNTKTLMPGQVIRFHDDELSISSYINRSYDTPPLNLNEDQALSSFDQLMSESVQRRMISDRRVGTFLSGGVDSSLVSIYAAKVSEQKISTYCVRPAISEYDESKYAREVAQRIGTDHHTIEISEAQMKSDVLEVLESQDAPFGDSSLIPTYVLCKQVNKEITVALAGDGGDELFMGYGMYNWADRLSRIPSPLRKLSHQVFKGIGPISGKDYSKYFNYSSSEDMAQHIISQEMNCFSARELHKIILNPDFNRQRVYTLNGSHGQRRPSEVQSLLDLEHYLPSDLLYKVDRASMANSLEVRVPFLDASLVEFALGLPLQFKRRNKTGKYLLKKTLEGHLPQDLIYRRKWGFSIPLHNWMAKELSFLIDEHLNEESIKDQKLFDPNYVADVVRKFKSGASHLYQRLWLLIQVVIFVKKYRDRIALG